MILSHFYGASLLVLMLATTSNGGLFTNPFFRTTTLDTTAIYEGLFSPENNVIVIIQNFYVWVVSSIGFLLLIPFYQGPAVTTVGRNFDYPESGYNGFENIWPPSEETLSGVTWWLRYIADNIESYNLI